MQLAPSSTVSSDAQSINALDETFTFNDMLVKPEPANAYSPSVTNAGRFTALRFLAYANA